jgi:uncharacterized SAM-binding protein YcdF (DUF218 family)
MSILGIFFDILLTILGVLAGRIIFSSLYQPNIKENKSKINLLSATVGFLVAVGFYSTWAKTGLDPVQWLVCEIYPTCAARSSSKVPSRQPAPTKPTPLAISEQPLEAIEEVFEAATPDEKILDEHNAAARFVQLQKRNQSTALREESLHLKTITTPNTMPSIPGSGQEKLLHQIELARTNALLPFEQIFVTGHIGNDSGRRTFSENLSRARAEAVKYYLMAHGIQENRVFVIDKENSEPYIQREGHPRATTGDRVEITMEQASPANSQMTTKKVYRSVIVFFQ